VTGPDGGFAPREIKLSKTPGRVGHAEDATKGAAAGRQEATTARTDKSLHFRAGRVLYTVHDRALVTGVLKRKTRRDLGQPHGDAHAREQSVDDGKYRARSFINIISVHRVHVW